MSKLATREVITIKLRSSHLAGTIGLVALFVIHTCFGLNAVYVWHKPTHLAHSFVFCSCVYFCLMALSTVFHSINAPDNSPFSDRSSGLISVLLVLSTIYLFTKVSSSPSPQWVAADAEIKVPSGENTELKRSPFIAWSRSVYSHTCCAYCQGFLPCLFLAFWSIHLHFF